MNNICLMMATRGDSLGMLPDGDPAGWKPAPGPLVTRWAAQVDPARVHPEYPRPQMVRPTG